MKVTRNNTPTRKGPAELFTGDVYVDLFAGPPEGNPLTAANVHFTPGSRTGWHAHAKGQTIWVTEGVGYCQREGGPIEVIRAGDSVFFEPGERHWHGAAPNKFMSHLALQYTEDLTRGPVGEVKHLSDEEYAQAPTVTD